MTVPPAPDPATPYDTGQGPETAYPPAEGYGAYDPYDPASDIAVTSGFGFPVPRPAEPAPVPDFAYTPPETPFAGPEFASGTGGTAEAFVPPLPEPVDYGPGGPPYPVPEFATHDPAGFAAVPPPPAPAEPAPLVHQPFPASESPGGPVVSYTLRVNGTVQVVDRAWLGESLLHVLRERLGLPGAKDGCAQGVCGACTVLVDGAPAVACLVPAATVGERAVTTIEGVSVQGGPAAAIQQALIEHGAVQCGFCVPGIVMSAHALLARLPGADEATIRRALAGHPCRCVGPNRMVAAVCAVAADQATEPAASLFEPADAPETQA